MMDSMHLLIVTQHYAPELTGNAPYVEALARGLASRGHKVEVLTTHPHYPEWRFRKHPVSWSLTERIDGVTVHRLRHRLPAGQSMLQRALSEFSFGMRVALGKQPRADAVLFVTPALIGSAVAMWSRWRRKTSLAWVQDFYSLGVRETTGSHFLGRALGALESRFLRRVDRVVVIHDRFRDVAVAELGVPRVKVEVIRNWAHLRAETVESRGVVRARYGWGDEDYIVLHAGNQGRKQGLSNVVQAAKMAAESGTNVKFALLGDGSQHSQLRHEGRGVGSLQFMPPVSREHFQSVLAAADVLLVNELPGVESMSVPSKLTSYFYAGRPVLAATSAKSITASEVRIACAGVRVDPGRPDLLLEGAERLRDSPEAAAALGHAGREFMEVNLTESSALEKFERIFATSRVPSG
jgi:colanic acid biosynthesis glycosyl transferase WcaI